MRGSPSGLPKFFTQRNLAPLDAETAVEAARIRSAYRLRLQDAIQVATAIRVGAAALITHDKALAQVTGLRVLGPA